MTATFKRGFFTLLLFLFTAVSVNAQTGKKKEKMKKHVCTEACMNGKHMRKHGEKGHTCGDACKAGAAGTMRLKDHICTDACHSGGKCVMAHGEKGHECTDACKKTKG